MELKVIDTGPNAQWYINTAAYRMVDPTRKVHQDQEAGPENQTNFPFEPGIKYKINPTQWMIDQPVMLKTDDEDQGVLALVQEPNVTKDMTTLREAYNEAHPDAPALSEPPAPAEPATEPATEPAPAPAEPKGKK